MTCDLILDLNTCVFLSSNQAGRTPFITAAAKGHAEVVRCLVELGAAVDEVDEVIAVTINKVCASSRNNVYF